MAGKEDPLKIEPISRQEPKDNFFTPFRNFNF